ncbi:MAG: hypothetical protein MUQ00_14750 [Candidatus Aminicenantes bacterium]|nr:hypothetical protein [Candidatus Aminicenantes bacterium]
MVRIKKIVLLLALASMGKSLMAQTETFDITTYTPPKGWKKEMKTSVVNYTILDSAKNTYCIIGVYASRPSSGDAAADFTAEWNDLVVKPLGADANPTTKSVVAGDGRKAIVGSSLFKNQGVDNAVLLTSFSVFGKATSVIAVMNSMDFQADVQKFLDGITFSNSPATTANTPSANPTGQPSAMASSYNDVSFAAPKGWTQTNYSDGVGLQSPDMECSNNSNYKIIIYNNRPFSGDLKSQVREVWYELFNPKTEGDIEIKKWTSPEGWEYITFENAGIVSKADATLFYGRVLLVKQGSQVSVIALQSNHTEYASSNDLKCIALNRIWNKFVASLQFKSAKVYTNSMEIPEDLLGRWESKITTGVSYYGSVSTKILAAYTFRDNGYCQSKNMFDSDADGKFSIKGNKITISSPSGLSETFTYRLESELIYDHWNKYLYLTDKNGNETKLRFQGD